VIASHLVDARRRAQLIAYHRGELRLEDGAIDRLLGIRPARVERALALPELLRRFGPASFAPDATPYPTIRRLLRWCAPGPDEVVYDLGAGHGRFVLYGAAVHEARFRGVELVPERVAAAERCRARLGLANASLTAADAQSADLAGGDLFFFFNPFFRDTLARVGERLREEASRRPLRIASWAQSNDYFARQAWLVEITPGGAPRRFGLRLFASRRAATR